MLHMLWLGIFFHLPFPTEPLLVDFTMICMEVCRNFCWTTLILFRDMAIPLINSDLQHAPSWGCRGWYRKACLAAWRWGLYPSLLTNLRFTLGLSLYLSELEFPICETNVTSHRFGNRSKKGWTGFKGIGQPWLVKWVSKCASPFCCVNPRFGAGWRRLWEVQLFIHSLIFFPSVQQVFDTECLLYPRSPE